MSDSATRTYVMALGVLLVLLVLLGATIGVAYLPLGLLAPAAALLIAAAKAVVVALYFMHLRFEHGVVRVFAVGAAAWLAILMTLTLADYVTRGWLAAR